SDRAMASAVLGARCIGIRRPSSLVFGSWPWFFKPSPVSVRKLDNLLRRSRVNREKEIYSEPCSDFHAVEGAARHVKRRQRLLHRLGIDDDLRNTKKFAIERQDFLRPGAADDFQPLGHNLVRRFMIRAEAFICAAVRVTAARCKVHAT